MPGSPSSSDPSPPDPGPSAVRSDPLLDLTGKVSADTDVSTPLADHRVARASISLVLATYLVATVAAVAQRSPLGHDESVYALRSRDLLDGWSHLSGDYWRDYRAPGLPLLLSGVGRVVGIQVTSARLVTVVLGLVTLIITAALGRRFGATAVGIGAAAILTVTAGFMLSGTTLLADVPGAMLGLIAVLAFASDLASGRLRWSLVIVPVSTLLASLSRFGAPIMVGAGLTAATVVAAPSMWRRRDRVLGAQIAGLAVVTAVVGAGVLLTTAFTLDGDTPVAANRVLVDGNGFTWRTGLSDLVAVTNPWSSNPVHVWSKPVALLVGVGVVAAVASAAVDRSRVRLVAFSLIAGAVSALGVSMTVGLVVVNYLVLTLPFWALAAAAGWDWLLRALAARAPSSQIAGRVALGVLTVVFGLLALEASGDVRGRHDDFVVSNAHVRAAAVAARDVLGDECVMISRFTPQVGYYSGCRIVPFQEDQLTPSDEALDAVLESIVARWGTASSERDPVAVMLVAGVSRQPDMSSLLADPRLTERIFEYGEPGDRRHTVVVLVAP